MIKLTMPHTDVKSTVYPVGIKTWLCFALVHEQKLLFCWPPKCSLPLCRNTLILKENKLCTFSKTKEKPSTSTHIPTVKLTSPCSFFHVPQSYSQHLWPHKGQTWQLQPPDVRHWIVRPWQQSEVGGRLLN